MKNPHKKSDARDRNVHDKKQSRAERLCREIESDKRKKVARKRKKSVYFILARVPLKDAADTDFLQLN